MTNAPITDTTPDNQIWSDFDYSTVDNTTAEALRSAGQEWDNAGIIIFEQMIIRGNIAEEIFNKYKGHYTKWCNNVAKTSVQTANNYRAVARHLKNLDPDVAKIFQARALYIIARDVMTDEQREIALNWLEGQVSVKTNAVDRELATIAMPSTPVYIRNAYEDRNVTKEQAYKLIIALNKLAEVQSDIHAILVNRCVEHGEVVDYIRQCVIRASNGDTKRLTDIVQHDYHFVFVEGRAQYEVDVRRATKETVSRYLAYQSWAHLEQARQAQDEQEAKKYWRGTVKPTVTTTPNGLVSTHFSLPDEVVKNAELNNLELVISYKVKKEGNTNE